MNKLEEFKKPGQEVFTKLVITSCNKIPEIMEKAGEYEREGRSNDLTWSEKIVYTYNNGRDSKIKCGGCCDYDKIKESQRCKRNVATVEDP